MNKFLIWDKVRPINGSSADEVFASNRRFLNEIVVFITKDDIPFAHAFMSDLRTKYKMYSHTEEEVAQKFLDEIDSQQNSVEEDSISLKEVEKEISILNDEQIVQNDEIMTSMIANTELFEMVLGMIPASIDLKNTKDNIGGSAMIEVYVTLILKAKKTIDDVPAVIREQVQSQLDLLTK